jgi:hypothetical protein
MAVELERLLGDLGFELAKSPALIGTPTETIFFTLSSEMMTVTAVIDTANRMWIAEGSIDLEEMWGIKRKKDNEA